VFELWLFNNEPRLKYGCLDTIKSDLVSAIIDYTQRETHNMQQ